MNADLFIGTLMHSRVCMHLTHWDTYGLGTHEALGEYYSGLDGLLDSFAEKYFGANGRVKISVPSAQIQNPNTHLKSIADLIESERKNYSSDLQNILDEMLGLVHQTMYKLSFKTVQ